MPSECFRNPRVRLRGNRENSQFWPIPASFVCYYSLILVAAATQTFREPRGPVTGNSLKLAVLVYCGQFCMLLLTDFGSRCEPNISGTSRSGYGELEKITVLPYCGKFCMLLLTDFGSRCDTNVSGTPGSGYVELVKTRSFGLFCRVF